MKRNMNKIAKTIVCTAFAALSAVSCEHAGFLERAPYSTTAPENFYSNESQMRMALIGCYETVNTHKIPGASYCQRGSYAQGLLYLMNAPSDDVVGTASSDGEGVEMEKGTFDESSRCIRDFWKVFYTGINRCNIILAYIDGINADEGKKMQFKAEAKFMRAFFYYHLAWNFGGVPIVTDYASKGDEARSSLKDCYELILSDLDFAVENLSTAEGLIPGVSVNRYTAQAYIGRICNYLAACKRYGTGSALVAEQPLNDFAFVDADAMTRKAKEALEDVVTNSTFALHPDYRHNFLEYNKAEQRTECMFLAELAASGTEGYWPNSFYFPVPSSNGSVYPSAYGGRHMPTYRGFYMYHPADMRRDWNYTGRLTEGFSEFTVNGYTYGSPVMQDSIKVHILDGDGNPIIDADGKYLNDTILHPLYNSPTQTYRPNSNLQVCTGKYRLARNDQSQHSFMQAALSIPLMRLADVYLMYAEALYFSGNEGEGRIWMNKVLERATTDTENYNTLAAFYHRDNFIDELLESRERELFMECSRKWDLIRFNRIDDAISSLDPTYVRDYNWTPVDPEYLEIGEGNNVRTIMETLQQNWMPYKIWLPISEEQRAVNPNLSQNAGWGAAI